MEIYEALKKDHQEVKQLLSQLLALTDDDENGREHLVRKIIFIF